MKTLHCILGVAFFSILVSCSKNKEDELKALKEAQQSLFVGISESAPFIDGDASDPAVGVVLIDDPKVWEELKAKITAIDGFNNNEMKSLRDWFRASVICSGRLIKQSKPTNKELQEAHARLSDLHTKFDIFISDVSDRSQAARFREETQNFMSWWKREFIF